LATLELSFRQSHRRGGSLSRARRGAWILDGARRLFESSPCSLERALGILGILTRQEPAQATLELTDLFGR
jgi:hypothetical protein